MSKQTAVDLIYHRAISLLPMGSIDARQNLKQTYERAKEMENEQTIAFADKYDAYVVRGGTLTAEQYYNETYGKNN